MMVGSGEDTSIRAIPLFSLPRSTREVLSTLMNATKVIPTDGPEKLFRDWRGLCALANITVEVQSSIHTYTDKIGRVLELWGQNATVGDLLDFLEKLDRYDVYEDVCNDLKQHLSSNQTIANQRPVPQITINDDSEIITYEDQIGYKQLYDAFLLYADEDKAFVNEIIRKLSDLGFKICTKDNLIPGHATLFGPVAKLISERCQKIILIYSPEFLKSPANIFFRDYAQAVSIESQTNKTIPIMYRSCQLPPHLAIYHMLHYNTEMYNFWEKLIITVDVKGRLRLSPAQRPLAPVTYSELPRQPTMQSSHSAVDIVEMANTNQSLSKDRLCSLSVSVDAMTTSSPEGSISSETSDSKIVKKKKNLLRRFYRKLTGKTSKEEVMVPC